jgi:hypothetical protein
MIACWVHTAAKPTLAAAVANLRVLHSNISCPRFPSVAQVSTTAEHPTHPPCGSTNTTECIVRCWGVVKRSKELLCSHPSYEHSGWRYSQRSPLSAARSPREGLSQLWFVPGWLEHPGSTWQEVSSNRDQGDYCWCDYYRCCHLHGALLTCKPFMVCLQHGHVPY